MTIQSAEDKNLLVDFTLVTDSDDIEAIAGMINKQRTVKKYDIGGMFAEILDGEYGRVYGFAGIIPYNDKQLIKLHSARKGQGLF